MADKPPFDLLALFSRFGLEQKLSLRDPGAHDAFMAMARDALGKAVANDTLMHGQRVENMFGALVISLGHYKLLNKEDKGPVYPSGQFQAPDYRVVLTDDAQWLIEVKNLYSEEPGRQVFVATDSYLERLQRYADLMHCPLKLAIYWARWRMWTLVDPSDLEQQNGTGRIDMFKAVRINQLAKLGDRTIGTTPPLKLKLLVDTAKERDIGVDGEVKFTIARAAIYSGGNEVTEPLEQKITLMLAELGEWTCPGARAEISGNKLDAIEYVWSPRERPNPDENFEMIGTLSTMFSRHYAATTLGEQGVVQTEAELIPDWFLPMVSPSYKSAALSLWRFILSPNREELPTPSGPLS